MQPDNYTTQSLENYLNDGVDEVTIMIEVRIHGRGGQGAVTTGQLLAIAAFYDGKETQTFPSFGVERAGAPVTAFVRISDEKINLRSQVYEPDCVLVLDASLVSTVDVTSGLKKGGLVIINSNKQKSELGLKGNFDVHVVDANAVAMEVFGKPIVNTAMLGAFAHVTKMISIESSKKAIDDIFLKSKGQKISDLNKKAIEEVYKKTN